MIIETDLGHDPDDLFTILYLASIGVNIRLITVSPGDPDQLAMARFLCKKLGLDIPVGASHLNRTKRSSGGVHHALLEKYGFPLDAESDGLGGGLMKEAFAKYPHSHLFIIGPASSTGQLLRDNPDLKISKMTMQGGFLPYRLHDCECVRLKKFEGKDWVPSFNPNGDRKAFLQIVESPNIGHRTFVGKNVCHTVLYDKSVHALLKPHNLASELFVEGMGIHLKRHKEKKFHDPVAAVCHLYPDVGVFVRGRPIKMENGWSTELDPKGDLVLADLDRDAFWSHIVNFQ